MIAGHGAAASGPRSTSGSAASDAAPNETFGTVVHVTDGDTLSVVPDGETGGEDSGVRVRILGIQAIEMTHYSDDPTQVRGECMAVPAYNRVRQLAYGRRVRLSVLRTSAASRGRPVRSVAVPVDGGQWQDLGELLIAEGLALPMPSKGEYSWNYRYESLAQRAREQHLGIFNPQACGVGPAGDAHLSVQVHSQGNGDREYAQVSNASATAVDLAGWYLRDSGYHGPHAHGFTFPTGTRLPAGRTLRVYVGRGHNTGSRFYMGLRWGNIFNEPSSSPVFEGDGAYLFDPLGNLRASVMYPDVITAQTTDTEPVAAPASGP